MSKTVEQLEEEVRFLMSYIVAKVNTDMPRWYGTSCDALLIQGMLDIEQPHYRIPTSEFEMKQCFEFLERAPAHLKERFAEILFEFKQYFATKEEISLRAKAMRENNTTPGFSPGREIQKSPGGAILVAGHRRT